MAYAIDLAGTVALVTGASSGLGARFARTLALAGATVALAARRVDRLERLRAEIEDAGGHARAVALDVTDPAAIARAVATIEADVGPIGILVNNAGVAATRRLVDVSPDDYDRVMNTNVRGAFFVAQEVGRRMIARAQGGDTAGGRIVNIGSVAGMRPVRQIGVYAISKAAIVHMTRVMAHEWGRHGINVNAVCPGYIDTEINHEHWLSEAGRKLVEMMPRRRIGTPEDLDLALLMLCARESGFVNGAVLAVDDGFGL
jgi:NAD(P)-dependent dehydrogenase (short-subunit alcohol dehydrogenase family)